MPAPSFTVYVDSPAAEPRPKATPTTSLSPSDPPSSPSSSLADLIPSTNKENINPLTGERVVYGKKRKTGALAVKACTPLAEKEIEAQPEAKKRKSSSSLASTSAASSKPKKSSKTGRKVSKKSTRRSSPMPRVEEEHEGERAPISAAQVAQAQADSRCRDLTVKPLADVSEAYEDLVLTNFVTGEEEDSADSKFVRDRSTEPQIRDYFSPPPDCPSSGSTSKLSSRGRSQEPKSFTTPERKRIYSAFTFKSPSPVNTRLTDVPDADKSVNLIDFDGELATPDTKA